MIPAEAYPGTFVTVKGACGKTTTTALWVNVFTFDHRYFLLEYESSNVLIHIFTIIIRGQKNLDLTVPHTAHGGLAYEKNKMDRLSKKPISMF